MIGSRPADGSSRKRNDGIEGHRARQRRSLLHAAAELRWREIIETAETDEGKLEPSDFWISCGVRLVYSASGKRHIFQQRHRAEKRAALVKHSHAPEHSFALRLLDLVTHRLP